ncbi:MAG: ATP-binding protein [Pseudomonadota bacterium]
MDSSNSRLLETYPWQETPLGSPETWHPDMKAIIRMSMASGFPVYTAWGKDFIQVYNDAYNPILGDKHPESFGMPARECWQEIWDFLGPAFEKVRTTQQELTYSSRLLPLAKKGAPEECYFDFSYSPALTAEGETLGVVSIATECTSAVVAKRRQSIFNLDSGLADDTSLEDLTKRLHAILEPNEMDCAAAALYSVDEHTSNPEGEICKLRLDDRMARALRPLAAQALLNGSADIEPVPLDGLDADPCWADSAHAIALRGRNAQLRGILVLIPHKLVPIAGSHSAFAHSLAIRFNSTLQAVETRQSEFGKVHQEKAEQETLYQFLFDNIGDGVVYLSTSGAVGDDEIVLAANPRACRMLGYTPDEVIGKSRSEFFFPQDQSARAALVERSKHGFYVGELTFRTRDGDSLETEVTSNLVTLKNGESRALTIIRDISHRAALERERAERVRLETIENLTGGLAHDFNNLLTVIVGSLEALLDDLQEDSGEHKLASSAMFAAERAGGLTNQLLAYSRRQALVTRSIDLNAFLDEVKPLLHSTLGEINHLEIDKEPDCPACTADSAQLTTTLLNLVANARDAMPEGGGLRLRTFRVQPEKLLPARDSHELSPGDYVGLRVEDDGSGIEPKVLDRIFEPFFTTKEVGKGSGLGLSMVQGFMRQLGGDVRLTSGRGQGTTIELVFPAASEGEHISQTGTRRSSAQGEKLLLVEDNDLVREQTRFMLEQIGFETVTAENAQDALHQMEKGLSVDLVLTDMVMPGGRSGLQLAKDLRKTHPDLPIVITTGHDPGAALSPDRAKGFEVLRKPYTRNSLAETLLRHLPEN